MIFDSHAHYDDKAFDEDRDEVVSGLYQAGVGAVVNVGASLQGVRDTAALAEKYPFVYGAVGVHPDHVDQLNDEVIEEMRTLCGREKIVAVGEIGLDYYWEKDSEVQSRQRLWFSRQMELAREVSLPVIIHSRDAAEDTMRVMKQVHAGN